MLCMTTEDGHETDRDPATEQPQDVRPAEAAWLSLWDEEYEHEYFFNEITNVSSTWTILRCDLQLYITCQPRMHA